MLRPDYQTPSRLDAKLRAVPLPHFLGKRVVDIGTDMGAFAFMAAERGACDVLGLDRNRDVRGVGPVDLIELNRRRAAHEGRRCRFERINLGKEWREFGTFDVALMLSVYHHVFECAGGDHRPIWYWLRRHLAASGQLLWEGPVDDSDPVVRANVSPEYRRHYTRTEILDAATEHFEAERIGPALHEPTREVWRFAPKRLETVTIGAEMRNGAGGATPAFEYADCRRCGEVAKAIGIHPVPGSLNLALDAPFDWDRGYYRAQVLDVVTRGRGLDVAWEPRWTRFYPLTIDGIDAHAFRFEGEGYDGRFVELIAPYRLRERVAGPRVTLCR